MLLLCLNISSNPNLFDRSLIPSSQGVPDSHQLSIQPHCTCEGCNPWKAGLAFISIDTSRTSRNAGRPNKGPTKSCEVVSLPFKICMMWWNYCDLEIHEKISMEASRKEDLVPLQILLVVSFDASHPGWIWWSQDSVSEIFSRSSAI